MSFKIGILGVGGYGGGEVLRLCATHPEFEVAYVSGASTVRAEAGRPFSRNDAEAGRSGHSEWDIDAMSKLDVIFASLPTGNSKGVFDDLPTNVKVVDIGGDNRYADGWTYGLADVWPDEIRKRHAWRIRVVIHRRRWRRSRRFWHAGIVSPHPPIIIDAKSGVSGAGRGGESKFGFADVNEDV